MEKSNQADKKNADKSSSSSGDYELGETFEETEENIFLSEDQKIEVYQLARSGLKLKIQSKKVNNGISRVVWNASFVMAQYIEDVRYNQAPAKGQEALQFLTKENNTNEFKILELGSGTGLGGFFT